MRVASHGDVRRVLMTADPAGGIWTYALELIRALEEARVEVVLATMGTPLRDDQWAEAEACNNLELYESRYKLEWMPDPWADVEAAGDWLLGLEDVVQPDLVHLNGYTHASLPWHAPVLVAGHSCVYSWYEAVKGQTPPEPWERYRLEVARGLHSADGVTAPSRTMLSALQRHYGEFIALNPIYNSRSAARFHPEAKEPFILVVGRLLDEARNISVLTQVASRLSWPVYVAGESQTPGGVTAQADGVQLLGRLSESQLADWMSRAAIFVSPSRYEPFGLTALEAGLSGCALVLGDIPSLREIWSDRATFVPPDDADALVVAIEDLIADPVRRARVSRQAYAQALCYSPARMAGGYINAYRRVAGEGARRRALARPAYTPRGLNL